MSVATQANIVAPVVFLQGTGQTAVCLKNDLPHKTFSKASFNENKNLQARLATGIHTLAFEMQGEHRPIRVTIDSRTFRIDPPKDCQNQVTVYNIKFTITNSGVDFDAVKVDVDQTGKLRQSFQLEDTGLIAISAPQKNKNSRTLEQQFQDKCAQKKSFSTSIDAEKRTNLYTQVTSPTTSSTSFSTKEVADLSRVSTSTTDTNQTNSSSANNISRAMPEIASNKKRTRRLPNIGVARLCHLRPKGFGLVNWIRRKKGPKMSTMAMADCCMIRQLEEGVSSTAGHAPTNGVYLPSNAGDIALLGGISVLGAAGVLASKRLYDDYRGKQQVIEEALINLKKVEQYLDTQNITPEQKKLIASERRHINRQLREIKWEKWFGAVSFASAGSVTVGQVINYLLPIGLLVAASNGVAHLYNVIVQLKETRSNLARIHSALKIEADLYQQHILEVQVLHFEKKQSELYGNMVSWSLQVGAMACATGFSLAAWGIASIASAGIVPVVAVSMLGAAVAGTLYFNNRLTSERYTPSVNKAEANRIKLASDAVTNNKDSAAIFAEFQSKEQTEKLLVAAAHNEKLSAEYRQALWKRQASSERLKYWWLRNRDRSVMLLTLAIFPNINSRMKLNTKITSTRWFNIDAMWTRRIKMLEALAIIEAGKTVSNTGSPIDFNSVSESSAKLDTVDNKMKKICETLEGRWGTSGNVAKLLAKRVLIATGTQVIDGSVKNTFKIKEQYQSLLGPDQIEILSDVHDVAPCCPSDAMVIDFWDDLKTLHADDPTKKLALLNLITEVTDQYLVYQLPKDARRMLAASANRLACLQREEEKTILMATSNLQKSAVTAQNMRDESDQDETTSLMSFV